MVFDTPFAKATDRRDFGCIVTTLMLQAESYNRIARSRTDSMNEYSSSYDNISVWYIRLMRSICRGLWFEIQVEHCRAQQQQQQKTVEIGPKWKAESKLFKQIPNASGLVGCYSVVKHGGRMSSVCNEIFIDTQCSSYDCMYNWIIWNEHGWRWYNNSKLNGVETYFHASPSLSLSYYFFLRFFLFIVFRAFIRLGSHNVKVSRAFTLFKMWAQSLSTSFELI